MSRSREQADAARGGEHGPLVELQAGDLQRRRGIGGAHAAQLARHLDARAPSAASGSASTMESCR